MPLSVVTGACGFIGSWMVEVLKDAGHTVRACDLPDVIEGNDDPKTGRYPEFVKEQADEILPCDLRDERSLRRCFKDADYVFHIAALLKYSVPWELLKSINVVGTENIFKALKRAKAEVRRVVIWSTNGVQGIQKTLPITEDAPPRPLSRYALSKWIAERIALSYNDRIPVTVIRPTAVYGPRGVYGFIEFVKMASFPLVVVPRNMSFRIPLVHAKDVCRAALFLAERDEARGEVYTVDGDSKYTYVEFMRTLSRIMGRRFVKSPPIPRVLLKHFLVAVAFADEGISRLLGRHPKVEYELVLFTGADLLYSNRKLKSLGFEFEYHKAERGLEETIRWYKKVGLI